MNYRFALLTLLCLLLTACGTETSAETAKIRYEVVSGNPMGIQVTALGDLLGNSVESYSWNFGDGQTDSGKTVTHTFRERGTYTIKLSVKYKSGVEATTSIPITVPTR